MTLNQRIKNIINLKKITPAELSRITGTTPQALKQFLDNDTKTVKNTFLERLIVKYPDINTFWLLTGKGEMLNTENSQDNLTEDCRKCVDLKERLNELRELKDVYKERFEEQKEFNRTYQDTITMYQKRLEEYENPSEGLSKVSS